LKQPAETQRRSVRIARLYDLVEFARRQDRTRNRGLIADLAGENGARERQKFRRDRKNALAV